MLKWKNNKKDNQEINFEKEKYELNKVNYLPNSKLGKILILCFIASDFIFIKQLIDAYFTQSIFQVWAASIVIACLIDVSPSILAGFLAVKEKKTIHYVGMSITTFVLAASFVVLAGLRLNSSDLIYQTSSMQITSLVSTQETASSGHDQGYIWMSILFCIMPVFTSIVSFVIGILENPKNREDYLNKKYAIECREKLFDLEANNLELELELERDLKGMNDKYKALEISDIENQKAISKELVKFKMAQVVGTPQALTNFMENLSK